jgi:acetyl esterase/lipase
MMKKILLLMAFCSLFSSLDAQHILPLYKGAIPNSIPGPDQEQSEMQGNILVISKVSIPAITVYQPAPGKANGTAVIICPGGGYHILAAGHEGADIARALNEWGVTAFVLKYRIPDDLTMKDKSIGPLQDVQRAIQLVREGAKEWGIDPHQIGIMGFSAGGHLAASAGTHYKMPLIDNPRHTSLRPDYLVLVYPVISFTDSLAHMGSRENLIGKNPSPEKILFNSNEWQVDRNTPPCFLVHASDDNVVPVGNSLAFKKSLEAHHVPCELHLFENGGHGFGMNNPSSPDHWMDWLKSWLEHQGRLKAKKTKME